MNHSTVDVIGCSQTKVWMSGASDAITLACPYIAQLNAPRSVDGHLGPNGSAVRNDALQVKRHPVVVIAFIDVKLVRIVVVWTHIYTAVAGNEVHLAVISKVARSKAEHGIVVGEGPIKLFKGAVSVALEVEIGTVVTGGDIVQVAIVVKILKLALKKESTDIHAASFGDVCEVAVPIVFEKEL